MTKRRDTRSPPEDAASEHMMFQPPWREIFGVTGDGRLQYSPTYGPEGASAWEREMSTFRETTAGGGLWDPEQETGRRPMPKEAQRHDYAKITAFVNAHSSTIPTRELEAYFHYYQHRLGRGATARRMGISPHTVDALIKRLRARRKSNT